MQRGDVVLCAWQGDFGKPRPALVIQSDLFNATHVSIVICPLTTHLVDAPLFRLKIKPSRKNGLQQASQIMVDKITAIRAEKITQTIGRLAGQDMAALRDALRLWLDLG